MEENEKIVYGYNNVSFGSCVPQPKKFDGLKILIWSFVIFFGVAFIGMKIESHFIKPDLESSYWFSNGQIFYGKRDA